MRTMRSSKTVVKIEKRDQSPKTKFKKVRKVLQFGLGLNKPDEKKLALDNKIKAYFDFLSKINVSNNQIVHPPEELKSYKVFIGKGNNFQVWRSAFKKR